MRTSLDIFVQFYIQRNCQAEVVLAHSKGITNVLVASCLASLICFIIIELRTTPVIKCSCSENCRLRDSENRLCDLQDGRRAKSILRVLACVQRTQLGCLSVDAKPLRA